MKKALLALLVSLSLLFGILIIRTFLFKSRQIALPPVEGIPVNSAEVAGRLAGALRFQTVSYQNPEQVKHSEFAGLQEYIQKLFPMVHANFEKRVIGEHSLLFTWKGRKANLKPVVLMAHMDVVPAETGSWTHPPFSGTIADGYIWGRGALDDKSCFLSILEAAEALVRQDFQPIRTIYLAFGHDEEVAGSGAFQISEVLKEEGVEPEFVLDEGLAITQGLVPGVPLPVALIGIAEKGYLTLELTVKSAGGHSSIPPPHTGIGILSQAILKLEQNQLPAEISGPAQSLFEYLGPELPFTHRMALANLWLFGPLLKHRFSQIPGPNSLIRTTTAVTMVEGGIKENVLPTMAKARVNFRIRPGDSVAIVEKHVRDTIHSNEVEVTNPHHQSSEPSSISGTETASFLLIHRTIREIFPDTLVAPGMVSGATDSRHFSKLTSNIYRFAPFRITNEDVRRVHGANERISVESYTQMVRFYAQLIRNLPE